MSDTQLFALLALALLALYFAVEWAASWLTERLTPDEPEPTSSLADTPIFLATTETHPGGQLARSFAEQVERDLGAAS